MADETNSASMAPASDTSDKGRVDGRRKRRSVLLVLAAVLVFLALVWAFAGSIRVPRRWDTSDITHVQLNGGTMTLISDDDDYLTAKVPLRALPVLMARQTGETLEAGGFDDSDPRILLAFLTPFRQVPVAVDAVEWELHTTKLKRVIVAGGTLRSDSFRTDYFELFGGSGRTNLRGLDIGTLVVHAQDPAKVKLVGEAQTYSAMNSGGTLDVSGLHYERYDEDVIQQVIISQ